MKQLIAQTLIERLSAEMIFALKANGAVTLPVNASGVLCVEVRPAHATDGLLDKIFKYCHVDLVHKQMDGRSGWLLLSARDTSQLRAAAELVSSETQAAASEIHLDAAPVVSSISQEHAQQINRQSKRVVAEQGDALLTIDCRPAVHALAIANHAEQSLACQVLSLKFLGSSGRVVLKGSADALAQWSQPNLEGQWSR